MYDINVPIIRTKRSNRKSQPRCKWITSALLKSINYKNRLYHKYLRYPNQFNRQKYIRYRNLLTTIIPNCDTNYHDYLHNPNPHSIFFYPVTEQEMHIIVSNLTDKKSSGHDMLNSTIIKVIFSAISQPLTFIMNQSLSSGIVPDSFKIAKVISVYKKGDPRLLNNYRPISILSSFSKIIERIIYIRKSKFLEKHKVLSGSQYGFREKHSTSHAVLQLMDTIITGYEQSSHTLGIVLDLLDIILVKLSFYGIRGVALEWFRNYLTNRNQFVYFNDNQSSSKDPVYGVPQGSILGPLLFSIYINDFAKSSRVLSFILFADDSNLFYTHRNLFTLVSTVNSELIGVSNWIKANKLSLNIEKTCFMLFSNSVISLPSDIVVDNLSIN